MSSHSALTPESASPAESAGFDAPDALSGPLFPALAHEQLLADYEGARAVLHARGEALVAEISAWLAQAPQIKVHSVSLRMKESASLGEKLARPDRSYRSLWEVTDLVGVRIVTYFDDAIDEVAKLLESRLRVTFEDSVDKRNRRDAGTFGYRSLHYVCRLGEDHEEHSEARCEIQVRTVLAHAWAEIEHDLGYKARDVVPDETRRRLNRLAGMLELADQEFVAIRASLDAYRTDLPRRIESAADSVALDRFSLLSLLDCPEVKQADGAIARALGKELGGEPFFPEYLLRMLRSSGFRSVAEARAGIRDHADALTAMAAPYFAFAWRAWRLSPDQMKLVFRGYCLFFLAHAKVISVSSLRLDKVEGLARLYRELDYPEDERAAQKVANLLVDALGSSLQPLRA